MSNLLVIVQYVSSDNPMFAILVASILVGLSHFKTIFPNNSVKIDVHVLRTIIENIPIESDLA